MRFAMRFHHLIIALAAASSLLTAAAAQAAKGRLAIDGGEFRLHLDDGRVLQREALVGAHVVIHNGAETIRLLINAVVEDTTPTGKPLVLYRLLVEDASGQVQEACQPDARGRRLGMPLLKETGITLTCTSGAEGKCILMGYRPWEESADVPMRDLHAACIHMVRADYGGDDRAKPYIAPCHFHVGQQFENHGEQCGNNHERNGEIHYLSKPMQRVRQSISR